MKKLGNIMSYKKDIKVAIDRVLEENMDVEEKIFASIKLIYTKAIEESKITGQSIESITYEIMEGVEQSLSDLTKKEKILNDIAKSILEILYLNIKIAITKSKRKLSLANQNYQNTIEREKDNLLASIDTLKKYAKDNNYLLFNNDLTLIEKKVSQWIEEIDKEKLK